MKLLSIQFPVSAFSVGPKLFDFFIFTVLDNKQGDEKSGWNGKRILWVSSALNIFMDAISNCLCRSQTSEPCHIYKQFLVIVL